MKEQISLLIELQQIDSEMKKIENKKTELPRELETLKKELYDYEESFNEEKRKLDELLTKHADGERELDRGNETLKKTKSRLLEVKTNKEYQALLTEIDIIKGKNDDIENDIIHTLDLLDAAREEVEAKGKKLSTFRSAHEMKIRNIEKEIESIGSILLEIETKQNEAKDKIEAELIKRYDIIKQKRNGRAVVPVWKEICGGCHMNIPPQMYNELQKYENVMLCPNCNRIMYWDKRENGESQTI